MNFPILLLKSRANFLLSLGVYLACNVGYIMQKNLGGDKICQRHKNVVSKVLYLYHRMDYNNASKLSF